MKKHITQKKFKNYPVIIWVFYIALTLFFVSNSKAQTNSNKTLRSALKKSNSANKFSLEQYQNDLQDIEKFLNNITNLTATFTQKTSDSIVEGKFYLSRNNQSAGKMRIEYSSDPKIIIVVNGAILSYHDVELDEISRLSTNTTPASFLTRPNISFQSKDIEITNVIKDDNEIRVSLLKKNRKEAGEFSLIFKTSPLEFIRMEVKNELDQIISVSLKNIDFNSSIPNKYFVIKDNNF